MVDVVQFVLDVTTGYENKEVRQKKIIEHLKSSYKGINNNRAKTGKICG
jgi:uncharacterized protein YktA (UPF0223 family)